MTKSIKFLTEEYTQESLKVLDDEKLLELRNLVATNLGVASVRSFKDRETGLEQTWKALEKYEAEGQKEAGEAGEKPVKAKKEPKAPKEPKERKPAKSSAPGIVKRPTKKMFSTIEKIGEHNGSTHGRAHRWPNYKDGMTIVDVIEGDGTEPWDVYNWEKHGIMKVVEPTDEQYAERRAAWYAKHGLTDPEVTKAQKAKEAAEKKAAAEAAKAAAKAAAEQKPAEA
jgi:hypothetical protein